MATSTGGEREQRRLPILLRPEELEVGTWIQLVRAFTRMERRLEQVLFAMASRFLSSTSWQLWDSNTALPSRSWPNVSWLRRGTYAG